MGCELQSYNTVLARCRHFVSKNREEETLYEAFIDCYKKVAISMQIEEWYQIDSWPLSLVHCFLYIITILRTSPSYYCISNLFMLLLSSMRLLCLFDGDRQCIRDQLYKPFFPYFISFLVKNQRRFPSLNVHW